MNTLRYLFLGLALISPLHAESRQTVDLSGTGWSLWRDEKAPWKEDNVFLPPVDLAKLPVNPPTGGWESLSSSNAMPVSVPGTVEEYLQKIPGPEGALFGVSWWSRQVTIPKAPKTNSPRKIVLHFEAVRMRAEIFVNRQLVGYDLIGNTPFEVDLTPFVKPGETVDLAIRITNPDGVFDWRDGWLIYWGGKMVAGSHGFGGISGRVQLVSSAPVYIHDLWVQNTPAITRAMTQVEINNSNESPETRDVTLRVVEKKEGEKELFNETRKAVALKSGLNSLEFAFDLPKAKIWDLDHPDLYRCEVSLSNKGVESDSTSRVFGFRWFEPSGIGSDAMFRLNGKRIVLRSAISWGFWPINGLFATPEMAEKQIQAAKDLGLNMLNNHRCIGQPILFEKADEMGLLQYEEPGDYAASTRDPFAQACIREKLRRMVIRDRSHPSLIIYNLANEMRDVKPEILADQEKDMLSLHALDPGRTLTRTSGWAPVDKLEDQAKMQMRPYDPELHRQGWYDYHHAPGPDVWLQSFYKDPEHFYNHTENKKEIVFWGEEGAISSPSRLELIHEELKNAPHLGWDGQMYLDNYTYFDRFLTEKNLRNSFSNVDALTTALGRISLDHQGRKIQATRMGNTSDGYVINGWESEIIENHSGIVDCFRNPKADPATVAYYNQPLYIPVEPRQQIVRAPGNVIVDFYAINEKNIHGPHTLRVSVSDPAEKITFSKDISVDLKGGDTYGQLLSEGLNVPISSLGGMNKITVSLRDASGNEVATGRDQVLGVDWAASKLSPHGAVWEYGQTLKSFFKEGKGMEIPDYSEALPRLDWIVVARSPAGGDKIVIPTEYLLDPSGKNHGLKTSFSLGETSSNPVTSRLEPSVNLAVPVGAPPDPAISTTENYTVLWEGTIIPPFSGDYHFDLQSSDKGIVTVNGSVLKIGQDKKSPSVAVTLQAGKPVSLKVEMAHKHHNASCRLFWTMPDPTPIDAKRILDRVEKEGTTLILIENSAEWMKLIAERTGVKFEEKFPIGIAWLGGGEFVKDHPLFKELPVNQGMDWPYQAVVSNGAERFGLKMSGEELVAGAYHCYPNQLGTSVGIIPLGKGKIIFSTLNIFAQIGSPDSAAEVARKLLCNYIEFSSTRP